MNGKVARKLRKQVGGVELIREYRYHDHEKRIKNDQGNWVKVHTVRIYCDSEGRNKYQSLKRAWKQNLVRRTDEKTGEDSWGLRNPKGQHPQQIIPIEQILSKRQRRLRNERGLE